MDTTGNTILITGGGSGIGRGLAEAFHKQGNQVIISGRRREVLEETVQANPGMEWLTLDIGSAEAISAFGEEVAARFPKLNVVLHNAGIMRPENLKDAGSSLADAEATLFTNLLGPMRLTAALLPLLEKQASAAILTVSSGLAFVPMATTPTYSATKAGLHSWTQSLRYQLQGTKIEVVELIPPYVQTELMGARQASDPRAMPLDEFIAETMKLLSAQPTPAEVCVERVKPLRFAAESGKFDPTFKGLNDAVAAASH